MTGIEPASSAWKAEVIAIIRHSPERKSPEKPDPSPENSSAPPGDRQNPGAGQVDDPKVSSSKSQPPHYPTPAARWHPDPGPNQGLPHPGESHSRSYRTDCRKPGRRGPPTPCSITEPAFTRRTPEGVNIALESTFTVPYTVCSGYVFSGSRRIRPIPEIWPRWFSTRASAMAYPVES